MGEDCPQPLCCAPPPSISDVGLNITPGVYICFMVKRKYVFLTETGGVGPLLIIYIKIKESTRVTKGN
jgi:hypothetical protein